MTSFFSLGIHRDPWHDTGAALVYTKQSERKIVAVSEERLDRIKDSRAFPLLSIEECLRDANKESIDEMDVICADYIINKSWDKDFYSRESVKDPLNINEKSPQLRNGFNILNHHLCHASAVAFTSGFSDAAILVVDGRGSDRETQSLFHFCGNDLKLISSTTCIGIGLLYASITQAIGFGLLQEGKTMGFAPYGKELLEAHGSVIELFGKYSGIETDYSSICEDNSYSILNACPQEWNKDQRAIAAYQVQVECERAMLYLAKHAKELVPSENLCITGGVALNSVANRKILDARIFEKIYINPCCSDTGIPLGAALYGYHCIGGIPYNETKPTTAYLGKKYCPASVISAIKAIEEDSSYKIQNFSNSRLLAKAVAGILDENKIVGVWGGRSEIGPRALGNRSILMSARLASNKDVLNSRVKHREKFRPFAPICLEEHSREYFEIETPCKYMLFVPMVRQSKRDVIPAVTHVDGTARLQTIDSEEQTISRLILEEYFDLTGVPVLVNTSFNDNNEPIVDSPEDAIDCFKRCSLDVLVVGNYILHK